MSYSITRYNGSALGTILDGTIDNTKTSLTLIGRNYSNYGQIMVDNLVHLLENFSRSFEPSNPISGQLWWDSGNNLLKIYTGTNFKVVGSCTAQASAPTTTVIGDLWWNTGLEQLYIWSGTAWVLIGPNYKSLHKTGAIVEELSDGATTYYVTSIYNDNSRSAIISKNAAFTPNVAITGFAVINPGYNANTSIASHKFWGTANNASYLEGVGAAEFYRLAQNNVTTGNLRISNDTGLRVGADLDLQLSVSGTEIQIRNVTNNGDVGIYANVAGTDTKLISIVGATGNVEVAANPVSALGIATKGYVDAKFVDTALTGIPTAVTAPAGTSNTMIATTAFVSSGLSGIFPNKIFQANSIFEIVDSGSGFANLAIDNVSVLTASVTGVNLLDGATAVTQSQTYSGAGDNKVATTNYVKTATQWWGGSKKFVSNVAPNGVNDAGSIDGDFFFQLSS